MSSIAAVSLTDSPIACADRSGEPRPPIAPGGRRGGWSRLLAVAVLAASGCSPAGAEVQIRVARQPCIAEIRVGPIENVAPAAPDARALVIETLAAQARSAADEDASRLLVLRLADVPLEFGLLSAEQQARLVESSADDADAAASYMQSVNSLLLAVIDHLRADGFDRISVLDLPLERTRDSTLTAAGVNHSYAPVLERLDAVVTSRSFILSTGVTELSLVRRGLPTALAAIESRPLFYRVNWVWRVLLPASDEEALARWESELHSIETDETLLEEHPERVLAAIRSSGQPDLFEDFGAGDSTDASDRAGAGAPAAPASGDGAGGFGGGGGSSPTGGGSGGTTGGTPEGRDADDPPAPTGPKRLLHFQTVGHSHQTNPGRVSHLACSPQRGWNEHVDYQLRAMVSRLGRGAFDWWGHNPGGVWPEHAVSLGPTTPYADMLFAQLEIAREHFPQLVDFAPLAQYARQNDIELYGYIGFPLCHEGDEFSFEPVPEHGDPASLHRWYGEFIANGFVGMGHDWTTSLPADSPMLDRIFPLLRQHGIEPFIEAVPRRSRTHLRGLSVVSTDRRWRSTAANPQTYLSEDEIIAAGGRTIHLVLLHPDGLKGQPQQEWRFQRSLELLQQGRTVAVALDQLIAHGLPVEQLVEASR